MTWWRSLSVRLCILTALVSPRTASGASAVQAETRVKGFFLVAAALSPLAYNDSIFVAI